MARRISDEHAQMLQTFNALSLKDKISFLNDMKDILMKQNLIRESVIIYSIN